MSRRPNANEIALGIKAIRAAETEHADLLVERKKREEAVLAYEKNLPQIVKLFEESATRTPIWFPLDPTTMKSLGKATFTKQKDGSILCNTGHFDVEIDKPALRALATETREARTYVEEFTMADGRRLYLLADGRLVNISAAEGHPAIVMDMSFANQALSAEYAVLNASSLERKVYGVPDEIDREIARLKLATMGAEIDSLTDEQAKYLASWDEGT